MKDFTVKIIASLECNRGGNMSISHRFVTRGIDPLAVEVLNGMVEDASIYDVNNTSFNSTTLTSFTRSYISIIETVLGVYDTKCLYNVLLSHEKSKLPLFNIFNRDKRSIKLFTIKITGIITNDRDIMDCDYKFSSSKFITEAVNLFEAEKHSAELIDKKQQLAYKHLNLLNIYVAMTCYNLRKKYYNRVAEIIMECR